MGEAADGEQAIAAVRRFAPDVVLMDIHMPKLDGIEATQRLAADGAAAARRPGSEGAVFSGRRAAAVAC